MADRPIPTLCITTAWILGEKVVVLISVVLCTWQSLVCYTGVCMSMTQKQPASCSKSLESLGIMHKHDGFPCTHHHQAENWLTVVDGGQVVAVVRTAMQTAEVLAGKKVNQVSTKRIRNFRFEGAYAR